MRRTGLSAIELSRLGSLTNLLGYRSLINEIWHVLDQWCATQPFSIDLASGARSAGEQLHLYAHGRQKLSDAPAPWGTWKQVGEVVTKVLPTESAHCYGAGCDLAFIDDATHQWIPAHVRNPGSGHIEAHPAWHRLADEAFERGLRSGLTLWSWDYSHLQVQNFIALARAGRLTFLG